KIIIDLEDEVVNLLEKEKVKLETIESLKSKSFELSVNCSSESENQSENDSLVVEKECDKEENPKVIALGMFKLNVSQCVSPISLSKSSCESNNVEIKLKRKRRNRKSSKQNVNQVDNDVSHANNDFVHFLDLDTFSSVRKPKNSGVIWKKKMSSHGEKELKVACCVENDDWSGNENRLAHRLLMKIFLRSKEKVVVSSDSERSKANDFSELKKITALLAKAFNRRSDSDQEINVNMVFMAQIEKVLSDSEVSSSSADVKISEVSYYLSESESESEFETSEYYDNSTNYGLFVNNDDDQEIFHDAIEYASENFIENHIDSQKDIDKSDVDHNYSKEKYQLVDKLIRKFNKKIVKC
nr:hypothetical protein [Tanacetum cinerariifolium]